MSLHEGHLGNEFALSPLHVFRSYFIVDVMFLEVMETRRQRHIRLDTLVTFEAEYFLDDGSMGSLSGAIWYLAWGTGQISSQLVLISQGDIARSGS